MTNATELDNDILRNEDDEEELRHQWNKNIMKQNYKFANYSLNFKN